MRILSWLLVTILCIGGAWATSFEDMDGMARFEQMMEKYEYDVVDTWIDEMHGDDVYIVVFNNHTDSSEIPIQAINDTFSLFSILVHDWEFSADEMAVMCGFTDGYFGAWYVDRDLADRIWYAPALPYEYFIGEVLETYYLDDATDI